MDFEGILLKPFFFSLNNIGLGTLGFSRILGPLFYLQRIAQLQP